MNDFRDTLYTIDTHGNRKWVYPTEIWGFFKKGRAAVISLLLLIYIVMPWITVNGNQAVWLDIVNRKFILFGATFWATDTRYLLLVLASLGISLFFFTSLFGRIWCGWACPETVFLEFVFRPIELWIEGNAAARRKLDQASWSWRKLKLKAAKYSIFTIISWFLSSTFLAYFIGRDDLLTMMSNYPWHNWPTFVLTLAMMGVILFQFGWFREQFCTVLCPYARFQSVLLDDSSLLVGYDSKRGEPRGKKSLGTRGDCIDCALCVRVCPTGIDIRNGLQLECVQCAACADACDSVMVQIGKPTGLIRYDTEKGLQGQPVRFVRPRVLVYGAVLFALLATLLYMLETRELSEISLFHSSKDKLFNTLASGEISNHLELNVTNKSGQPRLYMVTIENDSRFKLILPMNPIPIAPEARQKIPLFVNFLPEAAPEGKKIVQIRVRDDAGFEKTIDIKIHAPG